MTATVVTINDQGRVLVPKSLRDELALLPGTRLVVLVEDGRLVLEERGHLLRRLQAAVQAGLPDGADLVAELLAERRAAAAAESEREPEDSPGSRRPRP